MTNIEVITSQNVAFMEKLETMKITREGTHQKWLRDAGTGRAAKKIKEQIITKRYLDTAPNSS